MTTSRTCSDLEERKLAKKQERLKKKQKANAKKKNKQVTQVGTKRNEPTASAQPVKKHKTIQEVFEYEGLEKFLTPSHPRFQELVTLSYQGFIHEPAARIPSSFHTQMRKVFETLRERQYFQYDVVMAGGKNLSRTFVRRTLVGDYGITYKYLGLRIFAHAWSKPKSTTDPSAPKSIAPWFRQLYGLNQAMKTRTAQAIERSRVTNPQGPIEYNLTLINYMEPITNWELGLKEEPDYGLGKTSVSWHADSSLKPFSAIGVYNCMITEKKKKVDTPWRIALRLSPSAGVSIPPVSMTTEDGDAYYLVGDFNHDHQHMVLTGSSTRISSTHRVAVEQDSTLASIHQRVTQALALSEGTSQITPEIVRIEQSALTEVEMEWIRQYWIQGLQHDVLHVDWQRPIRELEDIYWRQLEVRTRVTLDLILENTKDKWELSDTRKILNVLLQHLIQRQKRRQLFHTRIRDKAYKRLATEFQPIERPLFTKQNPVPYDLSKVINELEKKKQTFLHNK